MNTVNIIAWTRDIDLNYFYLIKAYISYHRRFFYLKKSLQIY